MIRAEEIVPREERHPVRAFQLALGAQLRTLLEPVIDAPLPAELTARLAQLERARANRKLD